MITFKNNSITIHFGTHHEGFMPQQFYTVPTQQKLLAQSQFAPLSFKNLITLEQTHSAAGHLVTPEFAMSYTPYSRIGDYLITQEPNIGLGVATADCLPLVLYDAQNNAISVIHAGWRGSVGNIALRALEHMQRTCNTIPAHTLVFFGPAARSCCYEVQPDFLTHFSPDPPGLETHDDALFFDVSTYNKDLLIKSGIPAQNINQIYNLCTMCNTQFCSYRRDGILAKRQMTIAYLGVPTV